MFRKSMLTGVVLLIPPTHIVTRIVLGLMVSFIHILLVFISRPYRDRKRELLAGAASISLLCTFLATLLIKIYNDIEALPAAVCGTPADFLGFENDWPYTIILIGFFFVVVVTVSSIALLELSKVDPLPTLRLKSSKKPPILTLQAGQKYHTFRACSPATPT